MCYTVLRTPCIPNSGGRIVSRSLRGMPSSGVLVIVSKRARRILGLVAIHPPTIPMHIACMYHLSNLHSKLFILAHEMVDKEPENAVSWYAVGIWYLTAKKWQDARTYFRCFRIHGKRNDADYSQKQIHAYGPSLCSRVAGIRPYIRFGRRTRPRGHSILDVFTSLSWVNL